MKRENIDESSGSGSGKNKMATPWEDTQATQEPDAGMDELLAALGIKVRSLDMVDVALKLEQLDMVIGNGSSENDAAFLSQLSNETVHFNPSDLSTWLDSMLSEINPVQETQGLSAIVDDSFESYVGPPVAETSTITSVDFSQCQGSSQFNNQGAHQIYSEPSSSDYDLRAIPGGVVLGNGSLSSGEREKKRLKTQESSSTSISYTPSIGMGNGINTIGVVGNGNGNGLIELSRSVVLVDTQESGIRLIHTLMACAEAIQQDNFKLAEVLAKQSTLLLVSQSGAMRKVALYFAEGLIRRIYRYVQPPVDSRENDRLLTHFYETCPYLKFGHFSANQAILEAFAGKSRVHVVDFSMRQGMQWPALMQALALRPGGPPKFRLTGIGPPQSDGRDALQEVGWQLNQLAESVNIEFEYKGFVAHSLSDLNAEMLDIRDSDVEALAVNSVFDLHPLLGRPGDIEKVMKAIKEMKPNIVTVVEQEANHNGLVFLDRFTESLHYYSTLFDSLEGWAAATSPIPGISNPNPNDLLMSEVYLGKQICNIVACEGADRVERHEPLVQWRTRFESAGFQPVNIGSNAFKQASMLLAFFDGGAGYRVEENSGCLMLGWHTRPLISTSAWQLCQ